jgi:methyl-accepting chemotaxis protein
MTQTTAPWLARVFAGTELDQLAQTLQEKEQACAAVEAKLAEALREKERVRAAAEAKLAEVSQRLDLVVYEAELERQASKAIAAGILTAIDTSYAYIEFDPEGHVLKANGNFCRLLSYSEAEIVGKHHRIFVDPSVVHTAAYRDFWAELNAGKSQVDVFKRITKSGGEVWIQATYAPVKDEAGRVIKVIKIATDVTQDKLNAADWNGQVQAIGKSQAVIEFDLSGKILHANDNFLNALGYSLAEIQDQHHSLFVDPAFRSSAEYRLFWDKLGRGEYDAGQYKRIGKGGKEVWIQASYNPILDANGKPFKVVKYATDITAARLQAADFSGQLDAISKAQAVIEFSMDGKILSANQNFLAALGYHLSDIQGHHHSMFVDAADRASPAYREFWERLGRGEFDAGQYKRIGKGGRRSGSRRPTTPSWISTASRSRW